MKFTVTNAHLNKALKALKQPGYWPSKGCVLAQALTDKLKLKGIGCTSHSFTSHDFEGPMPLKGATKLVNAFDDKNYKEVRRLLPRTVYAVGFRNKRKK